MFDDHDAISLSDDWTDPGLQNVLDDLQHQLNQLPHHTGLSLQSETDNVSSSKPVDTPTLTPNPLPPLDPTLTPGGLPDAAVPSQARDWTPAVPSRKLEEAKNIEEMWRNRHDDVRIDTWQMKVQKDIL